MCLSVSSLRFSNIHEILQENLRLSLPPSQLHLFGGFTMSIQQKTHQIGYLINQPPNTILTTANIITYIFYCCLLVRSHFAAVIQYHHRLWWSEYVLKQGEKVALIRLRRAWMKKKEINNIILDQQWEKRITSSTV